MNSIFVGERIRLKTLEFSANKNDFLVMEMGQVGFPTFVTLILYAEFFY